MAHVLFGEESSVDDWMEQPVGRMPCFAHQGSRNPASRLVVEINRRHLKIAELVAPSLSEDVQDYAAYWSAVLGGVALCGGAVCRNRNDAASDAGAVGCTVWERGNSDGASVNVGSAYACR